MVTLTAAAIALLGVLVALAINGQRTERQRQRELHARALAAIIAYGEMPFRIRRRAPGAEPRARLSDELSLVKAELDVCQVLLAADGNDTVSGAFDELCNTARTTVGTEAHQAWKADVIGPDEAMNMGPLFQRLRAFNDARDNFADVLRTATVPRTRRLKQRQRRQLPGTSTATSLAQRRITAPQNVAGAEPPHRTPVP